MVCKSSVPVKQKLQAAERLALIVFQEGVCGGLPALRVLRLGERTVLGLLRRLPESVRRGDPVTVPAL